MLDKPRLDPLTYRDAMSRLAAHVQVITVAKDGERRGVTVTAACSVSDSPPTVLVCLNGANPRNAIFSAGGSFALNLLSADQTDIAHAFSGRDQLDADLRFSKSAWTTLETGSPVLCDAAAAFDCRIVDVKTVATHIVLFGEVVAIRLGEKKPALLYLDRSYRTL